MTEHLTCRELVELVTSYLEHRLAPAEATLFEEHIMFCGGCEAYVEQMRATIAAVGRVGEEDLAPETRAGLLAAFREWKRP
jgi:hypothetical protein